MGGQIEEHPKTSGYVHWGFTLHPGCCGFSVWSGNEGVFMDVPQFMTVHLSWVVEVKRAGLSLLAAKGRVKAAAHICI